MFSDRTDAGQQLAGRLGKYNATDTILLAIPRGGVPVAYAISKALRIPLDIILAKKIGHPLNEECAIGSVSLETVIVDPVPGVNQEYIADKIKELQGQLKARMARFRGDRPQPDLKGKNVIVVDDGIATGNTMLACIETLRKQGPGKIVVAVPVSPARGCAKIRKACDEFITLQEPDYFPGVGAFYADFQQVSDDEVVQLLKS